MTIKAAGKEMTKECAGASGVNGGPEAALRWEMALWCAVPLAEGCHGVLQVRTLVSFHEVLL